MKHKILLLLLACSTIFPLQGQVKVQLLTQDNLQEVAQTLGKTVFEEDKILMYDLQGDLIIKMSICPDVAMLNDADMQRITIRTCEGGELYINVDTSIENTQVNFNGIAAGSQIRVYSLNGTLLKQTVVTEDLTSIPVNDLPAGTYLIQINSAVLKIQKQ